MLEAASLRQCRKCKGYFPENNKNFLFKKRSVQGMQILSISSTCLSCKNEERRVKYSKVHPKSPEPTHKICPSCKETKLADFDNFNRRTRDGKLVLSVYCKVCNSVKRRQHRIAKPELTRASIVNWREKNPERMKELLRQSYSRHREQRIADASKANAKRLGMEGSFTGKDLLSIFRTQGGRCLYCGILVGSGGGRVKWHVDHFIPISRGGSNFPSNLRIACAHCNLRKHDKFPWEFMPERFSSPS